VKLLQEQIIPNFEEV
jgi:hypothetical protein